VLARLVVVLAVAVAAVAVGGTGPRDLGQRAAGAATSYRMTGISDWGGTSAVSTARDKVAEVLCPVGKQVLGGGAFVWGGSKDRVGLTRMEPFLRGHKSDPDSRYGYRASASTLRGGDVGEWALRVHVVCADPVPGWHIVKSHSPVGSSAAMQATAAACPRGQRVMGTGAAISFYRYRDGIGNWVVVDQGIGLQVARADGSGGIARAQAHEIPDGYDPTWQVVATAVCADPPDGYRVVYGETHSSGVNHKFASVQCPKVYIQGGWGNQRYYRGIRINLGAAVDSPAAPGFVHLSWIAPEVFAELDPEITTRAEAWENTPTDTAWTLAIQHICVGTAS
jgi:hypothetical protein